MRKEERKYFDIIDGLSCTIFRDTHTHAALCPHSSRIDCELIEFSCSILTLTIFTSSYSQLSASNVMWYTNLEQGAVNR
jgi:hypothetical protein